MMLSDIPSQTILIRGGGDLASGVALRLHHVGFQVIITELPQPLMVRRAVSFGQAVYSGRCQVEEVTAELAVDAGHARRILDDGNIAVLVDPEASCAASLQPLVIIDARMTKHATGEIPAAGPCLIGLGPGFIAGKDCAAVVETMRGPTLGRVIWKGSAEPDSRLPEKVNGIDAGRVLHAPEDGILETLVQIGDTVNPGQPVARVNGRPLASQIHGVVRGLLQDGLKVRKGLKIGDIDPRDDASLCTLVSDKALAIGGGVLEALFVCLRSHPVETGA